VVGYVAATVNQINVGELSNGKYAYVVKTQELEQSKHTTINIYNNLNFI
jgi:DNA gyrase inhibitor GyrI